MFRIVHKPIAAASANNLDGKVISLRVSALGAQMTIPTKKQLGLSLLPSGNTPAAALPNAAAGAPHHARLD